MMTKSEESKLQTLMHRIYDEHDTEIRVSPAWLATAVMQELDPSHVSPTLVYEAAHLQMRQIARGVCRGRFGPGEPGVDADQHDLFPQLQKRYPAKPTEDEEPVYILLEYLTEKDKTYNVEQLRKSGQARLNHADALDAWWEDQKNAA